MARTVIQQIIYRLMVAAIILLAALLLVGVPFQMLVRQLMVRQTQNALEEDCTAISGLATAYYAQGSVSRQDFFISLSIATRVSGADALISLAGPANKQGRIAADNLAGGRSVYRGSLGTCVVKVGVC